LPRCCARRCPRCRPPGSRAGAARPGSFTDQQWRRGPSAFARCHDRRRGRCRSPRGGRCPPVDRCDRCTRRCVRSSAESPSAGRGNGASPGSSLGGPSNRKSRGGQAGRGRESRPTATPLKAGAPCLPPIAQAATAIVPRSHRDLNILKNNDLNTILPRLHRISYLSYMEREEIKR
jgi:hypothetical protein